MESVYRDMRSLHM